MVMETLFKDIRYAVRSIGKRPGFATIAVLTLALGIGANTAIFSVVNAILLRPLLYPNADRIMVIRQTDARDGVNQEAVSPANFLDLRDQSRLFQTIAAAEPYSHTLTGEGEPQALRSWMVTSGFFEAMGVNPLHGRTFAPEEFQPNREGVVVIGYGLWQRQFGGRKELIGQKIVFNGKPHTVIGIMPAEFQFPSGRELWAPNPIPDYYKNNRGSAFITVVGRLKDGVTLAQAQSEIDGIAGRLAREYPATNADVGVRAIPLREQLVGKVRFALLMLLGAVGLVLLIACANVANLLLVRGAGRRREMAIRNALGAGRGRLVRHLLIESACLALLSGAAGVLLARWGVDAILALSPGNLPRIDQVRLDGRVLLFALGLSLLTALLFGLFPSLYFSNPNLQASLKAGSRSDTPSLARNRFRRFLILSEVALALVLLIGAGLLGRSFLRLLAVDPGFAANDALTLEVHVWGKARTADQRIAFFEQSLNRIASLPGVRAAGAVSALPFHDNSIDIKSVFSVMGKPAPPSGQEPTAYVTVATTDYFKALGIPLRQGRLFTPFDTKDSSQVVLVGETMARRYWPGEDPVGKKIAITFKGQKSEREVIGVVGDVRHEGLDSGFRTELFFPHLQEPYGSMTFVVSTAQNPSSLLPAVKEAIWSVNKDQPFSSVATVDQLVARSLVERRFYLVLLGCFAVIALVLAGVGVYGVISFSVGQHTQEIGVRMALGARASDIVRLIARRELGPAMIGIVAGIAGAVGMTRLLRGFLFEVNPLDPITFGLVTLVLALVALLACYIPARRATKVDPLSALRYE
jgi:putative ABC transport system permease protein